MNYRQCGFFLVLFGNDDINTNNIRNQDYKEENTIEEYKRDKKEEKIKYLFIA